jgi:predicted nucleic acid-binding protein
MPSNPPTRFYWDACVFLAYINGESARLPHVEALLDAADHGDIEIFTSELSVVEVAFAAHEKMAGTSDPKAETALDTLWRSSVKRVEVHTVISLEARTIIRSAKFDPGRAIRTADAIHLATAKAIGVDEVHTYEEPATRSRWEALVGIKVSEPVAVQPQLIPALSVRQPGITDSQLDAQAEKP